MDSAGDGRPNLNAVQCEEMAVSSECPKWKQVRSGKVLVEIRINACFIPSLFLASAYGCGLTQDTGTDGLLLWPGIPGLRYQKPVKLYLNDTLCKSAFRTSL